MQSISYYVKLRLAYNLSDFTDLTQPKNLLIAFKNYVKIGKFFDIKLGIGNDSYPRTF